MSCRGFKMLTHRVKTMGYRLLLPRSYEVIARGVNLVARTLGSSAVLFWHYEQPCEGLNHLLLAFWIRQPKSQWKSEHCEC